MNRVFDLLQPLLKRMAEISLAAMALLTLVDVLGRYVFSFPVQGSVELTEMLMVAVIFSGIPLATAAHAHVAVDIVTLALGPRTRWLQTVLAHSIALGASLLFGSVTWSRALAAREFQDQTTMLGLPLAPMVFFMSVLLFVNALGNAAQLWNAMTRRSEHA